jgi:hypothetical protein
MRQYNSFKAPGPAVKQGRVVLSQLSRGAYYTLPFRAKKYSRRHEKNVGNNSTPLPVMTDIDLPPLTDSDGHRSTPAKDYWK